MSRSIYAIIIALVGPFLTPFVTSSINIALPEIGRELGVSASILSWIPTSYLMTLAALLIPMGRLGDIYGRKRIFQLGITIFTISSALAGISATGETIIFFRILQGIGSAMIFGNVNAILASIFPKHKRGRAFGLSSTGSYLGLFSGVTIGGFLTQYFGWRGVFYFNVPLAILCGYATLMIKGDWREAKGEDFDVKGSNFLAFSFIFLLLGVSSLYETQGLLFVSLGSVLSFLLYNYENRVDDPVFNPKILKKREFSWNGLAMLVTYTAAYPITFLLSYYLQSFQGFSPQKTGLVLSLQPVTIATLAPLGGRLSDKLNPRYVAAGGMLSIATAITTFILFSMQKNEMLLYLGLFLMGSGFALFSPSNTNMVMSSVKKRFFGVASATLSTFRVVGQCTGMGVIISILHFYSKTGAKVNGPVFTTVMELSMLVFLFLSIIGILLISFSKK